MAHNGNRPFQRSHYHEPTPGPPQRRPVTPGSRKDSYAATTGSLSEPGKVLTKAEREQRKTEPHPPHLDGATEGQPGLDEADGSFLTLGKKIWHAAERGFEGNLAPEACVTVGRTDGRLLDLRRISILLIAFMIVFGGLSKVINYLLLTTRVSAQCTPVTSYIPVTYTETQTVIYTPSSSVPAIAPAGAGPSTSEITIYSTLHSTSTMYSTITITSLPTASLSSSTSYEATITTTRVVSPLSTLANSVSSTASNTATIAPPPYTSTIYSYISATLTTISTSTRYTTVPVSYASPSSSLAGPGSIGWYGTSSASSSRTAVVLTSTTFVATLTPTVYYGTGNATTSTGTSTITTTITVHGTSTLTDFSTSIPLTSTSSSSDVAAAGATASSSTLMLNSSSSASWTTYWLSSSISSSAVSASPETPSTSAGPYTNSTTDGAASTSSTLSSLPPITAAISSSFSSSVVSASSMSNTSIANGLTAVSAKSSIGSPTPSNSTATVMVSILSTMAPSSVITMLETTSTTMGLLGSSTRTVSSYFVWNGTTTLSYLPLGTTSPVSLVAAYTPASLTPSSRPGTLSSISGMPSISVSVNASSAAVSAISSNMSAITGATSSSSLVSVSSAATSESTTSSSNVATTASNPSSSTVATSTLRSSSIANSTASDTAGSSSSLTFSISSPITPTTGAISSLTTSALSTSSSATRVNTTLSVSTPMPTPYLPPSSVSSSTTSSSFSNPFPASSPSATPSTCGESGNFTINFDDLPTFTPTNQNNSDITQAPPIPNPYHHLTWSQGYVYAPQPNEPYTPRSPPHLAAFLANGSGTRASSQRPGEISDGPYESNSAFWFNAISAFFGCDNRGPEPCTLVFTGYTYNQNLHEEVPSYSQNATIPACPTSSGCTLQQVTFPQSFRDLSGLQIQAFVGGQERMFFMDDLAMNWANNTCAAGMTRQGAQ